MNWFFNTLHLCTLYSQFYQFVGINLNQNSIGNKEWSLYQNLHFHGIYSRIGIDEMINLTKENNVVFITVATYGYWEFTFNYYRSNNLQNCSSSFVVVHDSSNQFEVCLWLVVFDPSNRYINTQLVVLNYWSILNKSRSVLILCYYVATTRWMWRVIVLAFSGTKQWCTSTIVVWI